MTELIGQKVLLRPVAKDDIPQLYTLMYGEEHPEWKKWDAPYFPLPKLTYHEYYRHLKHRLSMSGIPSMMVVEIGGHVTGIVTYYWEHEPSLWLEVGIVIYQPEYWNGGYGTEAVRLWTAYLFEQMPLVRIGYTTWSGNHRMIRCGEKLGFQMEGRIRRCRYFNGQFYDSIKMGVLREEWERRWGVIHS